MSETKNPAAFPCDSLVRGNDGMSLRDWFAGQVAAGLAASPIGKFPEHLWESALASDAYMIADAMLAARLKA